MNFKDLKIIMNQIKKEISCNKCKTNFTDEDIEIIGTPDGEQYYFHAFCPKCELESIIHVSIEPLPVSKLPRLGTAPRMGQIDINEVLDMHNFLEKFDGNFTRIFKKTSSS